MHNLIKRAGAKSFSSAPSRRAYRRVGTLACIVLAVGTASSAAVMEDTVASVNGQTILLSEYQKDIDAATENWRRVAPAMLNEKNAMTELKRKVLDQLIDRLLLQQEAERKKIKIHERELDNGVAEVKEQNFRRAESGKTLTDQEVDEALAKELSKEGLTQAQFRDRIRKQLMIRKLIDEQVSPNVKPPEEADVKKACDKIKFIVKGDTSTVAGMSDDVAQAYVAFGERVRDLTAERVRVSHILVKLSPEASLVERTAALKKIEQLLKRVTDDGEDFAEVARKHSEDVESAARGGDLGFVLRGWMPTGFDKAAFGTQVGEISRPIETQFGYHIIRVQEKKAAEPVTYDKLKEDVAQFLFNVRRQLEIEKNVKALRATAHIEVNLPKDSNQQDKKDN